MDALSRFFVLLVLIATSLTLNAAQPPAHDQFRVAVYNPVGVVQYMKDPVYLQKSWDGLTSQVRVDKFYIESYRKDSIVFAPGDQHGGAVVCGNTPASRQRYPDPFLRCRGLKVVFPCSSAGPDKPGRSPNCQG